MSQSHERSKRRFEMTLGSWGRRASYGLALGLLAAAIPVSAAQIDITSCQPKQVRICSLDPEGHDLEGNVMWNITGNHIYSSTGETHHFTCDANCKFWISEHCGDGGCSGCLEKGSFLDHSWGKGAYQLIKLDKNSEGNYVSGDLKEAESGASCP